MHEIFDVVYLKISTLIYISLTRRKSSLIIRHFPHLIQHWDGCGVIERAGTTCSLAFSHPFTRLFLFMCSEVTDRKEQSVKLCIDVHPCITVLNNLGWPDFIRRISVRLYEYLRVMPKKFKAKCVFKSHCCNVTDVRGAQFLGKWCWFWTIET